MPARLSVSMGRGLLAVPYSTVQYDCDIDRSPGVVVEEHDQESASKAWLMRGKRSRKSLSMIRIGQRGHFGAKMISKVMGRVMGMSVPENNRGAYQSNSFSFEGANRG